MTIPDDAIEAAARAIVGRIDAAGYVEAGDLSNVTIDIQDFDLRAALKAAALYLAPESHDDALDEKAREAKEEWWGERGLE